jgi:hypothetical protein
MITLKAYFDDSGTHASSAVAVVGGLMGSSEQWLEFEYLWSAKLAAPLPGKPALRKFHLVDCNAGGGYFIDYKLAERDLLIHDFRQIIIDCKLISFAAAVDRKAWDELILGASRDRLGDGLAYCVDNCVQETIKVANGHKDGDRIAIVFDRGMWAPFLEQITKPYTYPLGRPQVVSITALSVQDCLPLQGADIVATENYYHAVEWLRLGDETLPRAHFRHYLDNMIHQGVILDRSGIAALASELDLGFERPPA